MRQFNINTPKQFEVNGEQKTSWLPVGSMRILDDGKIFIELNQNPGVTYMAFEREEKKQEINF